jgi:hypothetical protein
MRPFGIFLACGLTVLLPHALSGDDPGEALELIDKAIEAAGGREALANYAKPFVLKRKTKAYGTIRGTGESTRQTTRWFPDRFRTESPIPQDGEPSEIITVFNGRSGKSRGFGPGGIRVRQLDAIQTQQVRDDIYAEWVATLLPLRCDGFRLSPIEEIVLEGRPSASVMISRKDRPDIRLYFDKETFVLTKLARTSQGHKGIQSLNHLYDDYAELDGLVYPRKSTTYLDDVKIIEMEPRRSAAAARTRSSGSHHVPLAAVSLRG